MNDLEKLRVMMPHWIEHNLGHGAEFSQWADTVAETAPEVADLLRKAFGSLQDAHASLEAALEKAGGPFEQEGSHHGHGHHHHHH